MLCITLTYWEETLINIIDEPLTHNIFLMLCITLTYWEETLINNIDEPLIVTLSPRAIRLTQLHLNVAAKISMPYECYYCVIYSL